MQPTQGPRKRGEGKKTGDGETWRAREEGRERVGERKGKRERERERESGR